MKEINVRLVLHEFRGWWRLRLVTDNETADVRELAAATERAAVNEVAEALGKLVKGEA